MLIAEYDYDTDIAVQREEEREIAFSDGAYQTKLETAKLMRAHNYPIAEVCEMTGLTKEDVEAIN